MYEHDKEEFSTNMKRAGVKKVKSDGERLRDRKIGIFYYDDD